MPFTLDKERVERIQQAVSSEVSQHPDRRMAECGCQACIIGGELPKTKAFEILEMNLLMSLLTMDPIKILHTAIVVGFDMGVRYQESLQLDQTFGGEE